MNEINDTRKTLRFTQMNVNESIDPSKVQISRFVHWFYDSTPCFFTNDYDSVPATITLVGNCILKVGTILISAVADLEESQSNIVSLSRNIGK